MVLSAALLAIAIFVDLSGFGGALIRGGSFFAASFLCVGYFAGIGATVRFVAYPRVIPIWGALATTGAAYFVWFLVLDILNAKPQMSLLFVLSLALCYKVQRMEPKEQSKPVPEGPANLSDAGDTQTKPAQTVQSALKRSHRVSIVVAAGLFAAALAFSFPRFTETETHKGTGHIISLLDRGRSFIFLPPPQSQGPESILLSTVAINWPRAGSELGFIAIWTVIANLLAGYLANRAEQKRNASEEGKLAANVTQANTPTRDIFTDDVVRDILAGAMVVKVQGKTYMVHSDCLVGQSFRMQGIEVDDKYGSINHGMSLRQSIPFPPELCAQLKASER